ncbi:unnamed protein product [Rotaria sordida]|uniref:Protein TBATA n=1 Tax=Rotaria sordida TaxID=392033 RepID=A0A813SHT4_9BILA|nr:unnamed protein product [Rotaria sordida]CAF3858298.1 unnamed protein product [Rotaria sordida]
MTTDVERSRSPTRNRFGQLSKNMFFARHVAQPRYLRFITGAAGQRVCHVREAPLRLPIPIVNDFTKPLMSDPHFRLEFSPNSYNETLLQSYANKIQPKKRRERLLPPMPGWNPSGTNIIKFIIYLLLVDDTENWRRELAHIAEMIGLVTSDELLEIENRKETPPSPLPSLSVSKTPLTTGQYSRQSGRWNETPKSANRCRSSRRRTPFKSVLSNHLFCVDEQEREVWMLQVLCQILQTENINEIQSWLVSSGPNEKDAARQLIIAAIKGLEENGRISTSDNLNENAKAIQVNMDSFGSLLANRFPQVSSLIPVTPLNENSSRPDSRPRTAPATQIKVRPKTEFHSKSIGTFQTNLESINENTETTSLDTKTIVPQPTKVDVSRDIQILTLNDNEDKSKKTTNESSEKLPF